MSDLPIMEYSSDIATAEAPPPLPVGDYPATTETVTQKTSTTTAKDYLCVELRISPDDYPADFDPNREMYPEGVTLQYNRLMVEDTARSRYNMRKFCEAVGAKMGKRVDPSEWIGLVCKVGIKHERYEGEPRAQIGALKAA